MAEKKGCRVVVGRGRSPTQVHAGRLRGPRWAQTEAYADETRTGKHGASVRIFQGRARAPTAKNEKVKGGVGRGRGRQVKRARGEWWAQTRSYALGPSGNSVERAEAHTDA
jgi:hypothetical protein